MESLQRLDTLAFTLHSFVSTEKKIEDPSSQLPLFPLTETRTFWRSWLQHECAHRTIQISFWMYIVASALAGAVGMCQHHPHVSSSVMLSAHLWAAQSPLEFAIAWNQRDHLELCQLDSSSVLAVARPEDLDTFGKMHLVAMLGIDDVKGWYKTRGGDFDATGPDILSKWGMF